MLLLICVLYSVLVWNDCWFMFDWWAVSLVCCVVLCYMFADSIYFCFFEFLFAVLRVCFVWLYWLYSIVIVVFGFALTSVLQLLFILSDFNLMGFAYCDFTWLVLLCTWVLFLFKFVLTLAFVRLWILGVFLGFCFG